MTAGLEQRLRVRVARKHRETSDICSLELVPADGHALPPFTPGAHVDVHLGPGLTRQYSLCNDPDEEHRYVLGVLREPSSRGGSVALHDQVEEGSILTIGVPRNNFPLINDGRRSLLIAGGIGVTPILSMARHLGRVGADFAFHYFARSRDRAAFLGEIQTSTFSELTHFHFDDEAMGSKFEMRGLFALADESPHLYVCGPKGFMDAVLEAAKLQGWPSECLHYEFFVPQTQAEEGDVAFDVTLARSGITIRVAKDQTVIQALTEAGVEVDTSCEQGVCGTCLTRVLEGTPDHRDKYLTPEEQSANDQFLPCCSRSLTSRLVLDL